MVTEDRRAGEGVCAGTVAPTAAPATLANASQEYPGTHFHCDSQSSIWSVRGADDLGAPGTSSRHTRPSMPQSVTACALMHGRITLAHHGPLHAMEMYGTEEAGHASMPTCVMRVLGGRAGDAGVSGGVN